MHIVTTGLVDLSTFLNSTFRLHKMPGLKKWYQDIWVHLTDWNSCEVSLLALWCLLSLIGASTTLASCQHIFHVVDHARTTTEKMEKLTSTSIFVLCRRLCHGEINDTDYSTSIIVLCRWPCHGEINNINYCISIFVLCHQPCQGETNGLDYSNATVK